MITQAYIDELVRYIQCDLDVADNLCNKIEDEVLTHINQHGTILGYQLTRPTKAIIRMVDLFAIKEETKYAEEDALAEAGQASQINTNGTQLREELSLLRKKVECQSAVMESLKRLLAAAYAGIEECEKAIKAMEEKP